MEFVVEGGVIQLKPSKGWEFFGWDGSVSLYVERRQLLIQNNKIVVDFDLLHVGPKLVGKSYRSDSHGDTPGIIAMFQLSIKDGLSKQTLFDGRQALTNKTHGTFKVFVGMPSLKITPSGPIPDQIIIKSGTWEVTKTGQVEVRELSSNPTPLTAYTDTKHKQEQEPEPREQQQKEKDAANPKQNPHHDPPCHFDKAIFTLLEGNENQPRREIQIDQKNYLSIVAFSDQPRSARLELVGARSACSHHPELSLQMNGQQQQNEKGKAVLTTTLESGHPSFFKDLSVLWNSLFSKKTYRFSATTCPSNTPNKKDSALLDVNVFIADRFSLKISFPVEPLRKFVIEKTGPIQTQQTTQNDLKKTNDGFAKIKSHSQEKLHLEDGHLFQDKQKTVFYEKKPDPDFFGERFGGNLPSAREGSQSRSQSAHSIEQSERRREMSTLGGVSVFKSDERQTSYAFKSQENTLGQIETTQSFSVSQSSVRGIGDTQNSVFVQQSGHLNYERKLEETPSKNEFTQETKIEFRDQDKYSALGIKESHSEIPLLENVDISLVRTTQKKDSEINIIPKEINDFMKDLKNITHLIQSIIKLLEDSFTFGWKISLELKKFLFGKVAYKTEIIEEESNGPNFAKRIHILEGNLTIFEAEGEISFGVKLNNLFCFEAFGSLSIKLDLNGEWETKDSSLTCVVKINPIIQLGIRSFSPFHFIELDGRLIQEFSFSVELNIGEKVCVLVNLKREKAVLRYTLSCKIGFSKSGSRFISEEKTYPVWEKVLWKS